MRLISLKITISMVVVLLCIYGCSNTRVSEKRNTLPEEFIFQRHAIDSIVRLGDELFIYSAKYDTVIHETGIFTDLHLDYSLDADELLVGSLRKAIQLDASNQREEAEKNYLAVIARFEELQNIRYLGDSNGYWHLMVNRSIMVSYAYEQLEDLENAIEVLKPHLANPETYGSEIIQRYVSLCIDYYGLENVQNEFRKASETFVYVDSTYYKFWGVEIFGAHLDLKIRDGYDKEKYFIDQAISGIRGYELLTSFFEINLDILSDKHEHQASLGWDIYENFNLLMSVKRNNASNEVIELFDHQLTFLPDDFELKDIRNNKRDSLINKYDFDAYIDPVDFAVPKISLVPGASCTDTLDAAPYFYRILKQRDTFLIRVKTLHDQMIIKSNWDTLVVY